MSGSFKQTKTTGEKMFEQLANENKKLTQEKIKLNLKVMQLEKQNYELIENYAKLKSFVEANKGQFWKDLINGIKGVFNNIVNWFNS
jgi:predicted nuclease with TOPRIM domain